MTSKADLQTWIALMGADKRFAKADGVQEQLAKRKSARETDPRIIGLVQKAVDFVLDDNAAALSALLDESKLEQPFDRPKILQYPITETGDKLIHFVCITGSWKCLSVLLDIPAVDILDNDTKSRETVLHLCCRFPLYGITGIQTLSKLPDFSKLLFKADKRNKIPIEVIVETIDDLLLTAANMAAIRKNVHEMQTILFGAYVRLLESFHFSQWTAETLHMSRHPSVSQKISRYSFSHCISGHSELHSASAIPDIFFIIELIQLNSQVNVNYQEERKILKNIVHSETGKDDSFKPLQSSASTSSFMITNPNANPNANQHESQSSNTSSSTTSVALRPARVRPLSRMSRSMTIQTIEHESDEFRNLDTDHKKTSPGQWNRAEKRSREPVLRLCGHGKAEPDVLWTKWRTEAQLKRFDKSSAKVFDFSNRQDNDDLNALCWLPKSRKFRVIPQYPLFLASRTSSSGSLAPTSPSPSPSSSSSSSSSPRSQFPAFPALSNSSCLDLAESPRSKISGEMESANELPRKTSSPRAVRSRSCFQTHAISKKDPSPVPEFNAHKVTSEKKAHPLAAPNADQINRGTVAFPNSNHFDTSVSNQEQKQQKQQQQQQQLSKSGELIDADYSSRIKWALGDDHGYPQGETGAESIKFHSKLKEHIRRVLDSLSQIPEDHKGAPALSRQQLQIKQSASCGVVQRGLGKNDKAKANGNAGFRIRPMIISVGALTCLCAEVLFLAGSRISDEFLLSIVKQNRSDFIDYLIERYLLITDKNAPQSQIEAHQERPGVPSTLLHRINQLAPSWLVRFLELLVRQPKSYHIAIKVIQHFRLKNMALVTAVNRSGQSILHALCNVPRPHSPKSSSGDSSLSASSKAKSSKVPILFNPQSFQALSSSSLSLSSHSAPKSPQKNVEPIELLNAVLAKARSELQTGATAMVSQQLMALTVSDPMLVRKAQHSIQLTKKSAEDLFDLFHLSIHSHLPPTPSQALSSSSSTNSSKTDEPMLIECLGHVPTFRPIWTIVGIVDYSQLTSKENHLPHLPPSHIHSSSSSSSPSSPPEVVDLVESFVNLKDESGQTSFDLALRHRRSDLLQPLLDFFSHSIPLNVLFQSLQLVTKPKPVEPLSKEEEPPLLSAIPKQRDIDLINDQTSFTDFVITVSGPSSHQEIHCHRVFLMRSEYFKMALHSHSNWKEKETCSMEFKDLQMQTVLVYLHFLYTDALPQISPSSLSVNFSSRLSLTYSRFVDFLIDLLVLSHRFNEPALRLCALSMIPSIPESSGEGSGMSAADLFKVFDFGLAFNETALCDWCCRSLISIIPSLEKESGEGTLHLSAEALKYLLRFAFSASF